MEKLISIVVREIAKEILKVTTGIEAVNACRNHPDLDLVLMDIKIKHILNWKCVNDVTFSKSYVTLFRLKRITFANNDENDE